MKTLIKKLVKQVLWNAQLDLTRNMKYDRYTYRLLRSVLDKNSNCIDIGCHKGEILDWIIQFAPQGTHRGIEPIPYLFENLQKKYTQANIHLYPCALSNKSGNVQFTVVKNAPAYSGLRERKYAVEHPDLEKIDVELKQLDELIPVGEKIRLIKLDVEGAELDVLKGSTRILKESKPYVLFEFGLGSSEYYQATPEEMFDLLLSNGLDVYTLKDWLNKSTSLSKQAFIAHYKQNSEYYFLAAPR